MSYGSDAESWRVVADYPDYDVSCRGRVRSRRSSGERILRQVTVRGYMKVNLHNDAGVKMLSVHRLVLEAFVGPCPRGLVCRHLNSVRSDNRVENLVWGTHKENANDRERTENHNRGSGNPRAKLSDSDVAEMRKAFAGGGVSFCALAKKYGVTSVAVRYAVRGATWSNVEAVGASDAPSFVRASRLAAEDIAAIVANRGFVTQRSLAEVFGVSVAYVSLIQAGKATVVKRCA